MQEPTQERGIDFNGSFLVESAILALLSAPIVPHWLAGWLLTGAFIFSGFFCVTFFFMHRQANALKEISDRPYVVIYSHPDLYREFRLVTSTVLLLSILLAWLGFAGLLWTFDSFFAMFIAIHCGLTSCYPLTHIYSMKVELDETNKMVSGGEAADRDNDEPI